MEHAPWHAGGAACRRPRLVEAPDGLAVRAREDVRDRSSELAFAVARHRPAPFEERAQLGREREHAALAGLRRAGIEPDLTDVERDVRPAEPGGLRAPPPARRVEERHEVGEVRRESAADGLELVPLEEPASHIVFAQKGDVRSRRKCPCPDREGERALQDRQLAIDGGVLRALVLPTDDVPSDVGGGDGGHAAAAEERREMQAHVPFDVDERALAVDPVVVEDVADGGAKREPGDRRAHARSEGPTVALFQTCFGHRYLVGDTARPWMRAVV